MLKLMGFILLLCANIAFASPMDHMMTTKEKLRLSLWFEGIETKNQTKNKVHSDNSIQLPEEIERALIKM